MKIWNLLLPQIDMQLNLLQFSHVTPNVCVWTALHGQHDFNRHPLASLGIVFYMMEHPDKQKNMGHPQQEGALHWNKPGALPILPWIIFRHQVSTRLQVLCIQTQIYHNTDGDASRCNSTSCKAACQCTQRKSPCAHGQIRSGPHQAVHNHIPKNEGSLQKEGLTCTKGCAASEGVE